MAGAHGFDWNTASERRTRILEVLSTLLFAHLVIDDSAWGDYTAVQQWGLHHLGPLH